MSKKLLRAKAEAELASRPPAPLDPQPVEQLLHELRVHQIELEMQNDELRRAQVALEESRDRYIDLYEFAPVGYLTLNRSGMIEEINLAGAALLGVNRKELLHHRFASLVAAENREFWHRHFMHAIQHSEQQNCEVALQRGEGAVFHARLNSTQIKAGTECALRIAFADISESKRAEQILKNSHEQLKTFIRQAPVSIAMFDRGMNYLAASGRWLTEYGRGGADLIGRNHYEVHPDTPSDWKDIHQQALAGATLKNNEGMWMRDDGSKQWLRWAVLPWIDAQEAIGGIIVYSEDITAHKVMEREIQLHRTEMEHLQTKQVAAQTAAAFAHEMNQPLLAISSYSAAMLKMLQVAKPDLDEILTAVVGCEKQALRIGLSIRAMFESFGTKKFTTEEFDLNKEIIATLDTARQDYELKFTPVFNLEENLPLVRANRTHVQKVLLNLLQNGSDAMQAAGVAQPTITVTARKMPDGKVAQVTVQDNGPGVKEEDFWRLFEPLFTTKAHGLGMGLAISRSLIETNGGELWLDPIKKTGATFHLSLPFAARTALRKEVRPKIPNQAP